MHIHVSEWGHHYTPRFNEVEMGVYWFYLVRLSRLSVCGQNHVYSVSSTILIGSISYLHILSSIFIMEIPIPEGVSPVMFVSKNKNLKFWRFLKICNFDFVSFWLGIQYDSMVWVIMRRRGVSSERRCSSCSSYFGWCLLTYVAASHYLNQYWLIINWTHRKRLQWNLNQNNLIFSHWIWKCHLPNRAHFFSGCQYVKKTIWKYPIPSAVIFIEVSQC